jgi:superfamily II DNA or RNA helicase
VNNYNYIENSLTFLADRCNGASTVDGVGFNGGDTGFGKSLAEVVRRGQRLTMGQARSAYSMLAKYSAQLNAGGLVRPEWGAIEGKYQAPLTKPVKAAQVLAGDGDGEVPAPQKAAATATPHIHKLEGVPPRSDRYCLLSPDKLEVKIFFTYNPALVTVVKELPDRYFHGEATATSPKHWRVPVEHAQVVIDTLQPLEFDISTEVMLAADSVRSATEIAAEALRQKAIAQARELERLLTLAEVDQPFGDEDWRLRDYQREGVQFLLARTKGTTGTGAILADDMGLGKTVSLLFAAKALRLAYGYPILVVCPVSIAQNWHKEAAMVGTEVETFSWGKLPSPLEAKPYVIIADEAHYAQSETSARGKALMTLATHKNCAAAWLATGTPMKNGRPLNLFPLLKAVGHRLAGDPWLYKKKYCNAHQKDVRGKLIWDFNGSAHLQELSELTSDLIIRRMKSEVLKELPEKTRIMKTVELTPKEEREFRLAIDTAIEDYHARIALAKPEEKAGMESALAIVTLTQARKISSEFKIARAIEMAEELLENGQQVVIFTEFTESAVRIREGLHQHHAEILTGGTREKDRQVIVDRFQSGQSKVFVGTVKAGGVGITLTSASNLLMVDRPWTPGDAYQAEDRIYRMSQKNACMIYWMQVSDIDVAIDALIQDKQQRIELVLKGKRKTFRGLKSVQDIADALVGLIQPEK